MDVVAKKIYITWGEVGRLVDNLCEQIRETYTAVECVGGLARGGLIPAVMISHRLKLPYIQSADFVKPDGDHQQFITLPSGLLVVDDICDTGATMEKYRIETCTAVLHHKPHTACMTPNMYAKLHEGDEWIVYPWERNDSETIQDYKLDNTNKFHILKEKS